MIYFSLSEKKQGEQGFYVGVAEAEPEDGFKTSVVILFAFLGGAAFPTLPYVAAGIMGLGGKATFITATCITVIGLFRLFHLL